MLLNDTKGSLGMFSSVGKTSMEKFHILTRKDEILNGKIKKKVFSNNFEPEELDFSNDSDDQDENKLLYEANTKGKSREIVKVELREVKRTQVSVLYYV